MEIMFLFYLFYVYLQSSKKITVFIKKKYKICFLKHQKLQKIIKHQIQTDDNFLN